MEELKRARLETLIAWAGYFIAFVGITVLLGMDATLKYVEPPVAGDSPLQSWPTTPGILVTLSLFCESHQ